jgi:hypothetical protein
VDSVRRGLLPVRTEHTVLELIHRMLDAKLPTDLRVALVETMFDYQPAQWFGKVGSPPTPPPWDNATKSALELALELADVARADKHLPAPLRNRVAATRQQIAAALRSR